MDETIGEIRLFAGNFAPERWLHCDGRLLSADQYPALFAVVGFKYGGDNGRMFALPDMEPLKEKDGGQTPIRYIICVDGMFPDMQ